MTRLTEDTRIFVTIPMTVAELRAINAVRRTAMLADVDARRRVAR